MVLARTGAERQRDGRRAARAPACRTCCYGQEGLLATPEAGARAARARRGRRARRPGGAAAGLAHPLLRRCRSPTSPPAASCRRRIRWSRGCSTGRRSPSARRYPALFRSLLRDSGLVRRLLATRQGERELTNYQHLFDLLLEEAHRAPADARRAGDAAALLDRRAQRAAGIRRRRAAARGGARRRADAHHAQGQGAARRRWCSSPGWAARRRSAASRCASTTATASAALHLGKDPVGEIAAAIERRGARGDRAALLRGADARPLPPLPARRGVAHADSPWRLRRATGWRRLQAAARRAAGFERAPSVECAGRGAGGRAACARVAPRSARCSPVAAERGRWLPALRRRARRAASLTSYTRIRRLAGRVVAARGERRGAGERRRRRRRERGAGAPLLARAAGELPGGRGTGIFLHRLLEELDPATVRAAADLGGVAGARRRRCDAAASVAAERASTPRPLPGAPPAGVAARCARRSRLDGLALPRGLCEAERPRGRDGAASSPSPRPWHPRARRGAPATTAAPPFRAGRGFVQGVVDLVFEHDGRTYFVDWKSDRLPAWDEAAIRAHVVEHYAAAGAALRRSACCACSTCATTGRPRAALRRPALLLPARHGPGRRRRPLRAARAGTSCEAGRPSCAARATGARVSGGWTPTAR